MNCMAYTEVIAKTSLVFSLDSLKRIDVENLSSLRSDILKLAL